MKRIYAFLFVAIMLFCGSLVQQTAAQTLIDENFDAIESGAIPANWDNSSCSNPSYPWSVYGPWNDFGYSIPEDKGMVFNTNSAGANGWAALKTPLLNLDANYFLKFVFFDKVNGTATNVQEFSVYISTDGGATYTTPVYTYDPSNRQDMQQITVDLSAYNGQNNVKLVFYAKAVYSNKRICIDDVKVYVPPTCAKPVNLALNTLGSTDATIQWDVDTEGSEPSSYTITVLETADLDGDPVHTASFAAPGHAYYFSGLTPNTSYSVRLKGDCTAEAKGLSEMSKLFEFTTLCSAQALPYVNDFNSETTGSQPTCLYQFDGGKDASFAVSEYEDVNNAGKSLAVEIPKGQSVRIAFPQFTTTASGLEVEMKVKGSYTWSGVNVMYGFMSDPSSPSTFEQIGSTLTFDNNNYSQWQPIVFNGSTSFYASQQVYPVIVFQNQDEWSSFTAYIDDVDIHVLPTCPRVDNVALVSVTDNSATISFTAASSATSYEVELQTKDGTKTYQTITAAGVITGLTQNTQYTVRVRAYCSATDVSSWNTYPLVFKTACGIPTDPTMFEDFEEYYNSYSWSDPQAPDCWSMEYINKGTSSYQMPFGPSWNSYYASSGNICMQLNDMPSGTTSKLVLPPFISGAADQYTFRCKVYRQRNSSVEEGLKVYYNSTSEIDETKFLGWMYNSYTLEPVMSNEGLYEYEWTIPNVGITYIILEGISQWGSSTYFDDVQILRTPTCKRPDGYTASLSDNDLTISISNSVSGAALVAEYSINGGATIQANIVNNQFTIQDLPYSSVHSITGRIANICPGNDTSEWVLINEKVTTPCSTITTFPYVQNFENTEENQMPVCWEYVYSGSWSYSVYTNSWPTHASTRALYFSGIYSGSFSVYTPKFNFPTANYRVKFWVYRRDTSNDINTKLSVYAGPDKDYTTATLLAAYSQSVQGAPVEANGEGWYEYICEIPSAGEQYIIFTYDASDYGYYISIDDVTVEAIPMCDEVRASEFVQTSISSTSATYSLLSDPAVAAGWEVAYGIGITSGNDAAATVVSVPAGTSTVTLTGLTPESTYSVYVRYNCNGVMGEWQYEAFTLKTPCAEPVVDLNNSFFEDFESYEVYTELTEETSCYIAEDLRGWNQFWKVYDASPSAEAQINPFAGDRAAYARYSINSYIIRKVSLKAGIDYTMSIYANADANCTLEFYLGQGSRIAQLSKLINEPMNYTANSNWQYYEVYLSVPQDGIYSIAVGVDNTKESHNVVALDNWKLEAASCIPPTSMMAANLTSTSADLFITSNGEAWDVVISSEPIYTISLPEQGGDFVMRDTLTTPYGNTITGLQPNTTYYYAARTVCTGSESSVWSKVYQFRTLCALQEVPFFEDFEDENALACWTELGNGQARVSHTRSYRGSNSMGLTNMTYVSPQLNISGIWNYQVTGRVYSNAANPVLIVGAAFDPNEIGSVEMLPEIQFPSGQWYEFSCNFASFNDPDYEDWENAQHIVFIVTSVDDDVYYFDDIDVTLINSCVKPQSVAINKVKSTSVEFSWIDASSATQWIAEVYDVDHKTVVYSDTLTSASATVNGLQSATTYYARVASICGENSNSNFTRSVVFSTPCIASLPYTEGFETVNNNTINEQCFNILHYTTSGADPAYFINENTAKVHSGSKALSLFSCNSVVDMIVLPAFDVPLSRLMLSFYNFGFVNSYGESGSNVPMTSVGVVSNPNDPTTYVNLMNCSRNTAYELVEYDFSTLSSAFDDYYIAIKVDGCPMGSTNSYFNNIDDISVIYAPLCPAPKSATVSNITSNSCTVNVTATRGAIEYALLTQGQSLNDAQAVEASGTYFTINDLNPYTQYSLYVRAVCNDGVDESEWVGPYNFQTACAAIMPVPYNEPIEGNTTDIASATCLTVNDIWATLAANNSMYRNAVASINNFGTNYLAPGSNAALRIYNSESQMQAVILPEFTEDIATLVLEFYYRTYSSNAQSSNCVVGYITNPNDITTAVVLGSYSPTTTMTKVTADFSTFTVPDNLTGAHLFIGATRANAAFGDMYDMYIDEISVYKADVCAPVTALSATTVDINELAFSWTSIGSTEYLCELSHNGVVDQTVTTTNTSISFNNLLANTNYTLSVSAKCGEKTAEAVTVSARTLIAFASLPYVCTFDDAAEASNWSFVQSRQNNLWTIGTSAGANNALYVSNNGSAFTYDATSAAVVYATRRISMPYSGDVYDIAFDWKGSLAADDYVRAFIVPANYTLTAGTQILSKETMTADNVTVIDGGALCSSSDWSRVEYRFTEQVLGVNDYMLVFQWFNNDENGGATSLAIDNVSVKVETCQPQATIAATDSSATFTFVGAQKVYYTVSTDSRGANVVAGPFETTDAEATVASLAANTVYYLNMRSVCSVGDTSITNHVAFKTKYRLNEVPFVDDFESNATDAAWVFVNSAVNGFVFGTNASAQNGGTRSLYVSRDASAYAYNNTREAVSYAILPLNLPQGRYRIAYDWKAYGEQNIDYAHAALIPYDAAELLTADQLPAGVNHYAMPSSWMRVESANENETEKCLNLSSSWNHVEQNRAIRNAGYYALVFLWTNDDANGVNPPLAIDNLVVEKVACPEPAISIVSAFEDTLVIHVMNVGKTNPSTTILLDESEQNPTATPATYTQSDFTVTYTGLVPGRTYYIHYSTSCGFNTLVMPVRTQAVAQLPYTCGFETETEQNGWDLATEGTNLFTIGNATSAIGSNALYISNNASSYTYTRSVYANTYATQIVNLPAGRLHASYQWKGIGLHDCTNGNCVDYDYGLVGLMPINADVTLVSNTSANEPVYVQNSKFTDPIIWLNNRSVMNNQQDWATCNLETIIPEAGLYYLVVGWRNHGYSTGSNPIAIDDIHLWVEACERPYVRINDIGVDPQNSAKRTLTVEFEADKEADIYYALTYSAAAPTADADYTLAGHFIKGSTVIDDVTGGATVYIHAYAQCNATDRSTVETISYKVPAEVFDYLPYITNFSDAADNAKWYFANGEQTNHFIIGNDAAAVKTGTKSLYIAKTNDVYGHISEETYAYAYRMLYFNSDEEYDVSYDWQLNGNVRIIGRLFLVPADYDLYGGGRYVGVASENRGGMWGPDNAPNGSISISGSLCEVTTWQHVDTTLVVPQSGLYKLVVAYQMPIAYNTVPAPALAIDNISITNYTLPATSLTANNITSSQATLNWSIINATYDYHLIVEGAEGTVLDTIFRAPTFSHTLRGLQIASAYTASIQCLSGAQYGPITTIDFETNCEGIAVPYMNKFEYGNNILPGCFTASNTTGATNNWNIQTETLHLNPTQASTYRVSTPSFAIPQVGDYVLRFDYRLNQTLVGDQFSVSAIGNDGVGVEIFTTSTATNGMQPARASLSDYKGQNVRFVFNYTTEVGTSGYAEIDNFFIVLEGNYREYHDTLCYGVDYIRRGFNVLYTELLVGDNYLSRSNQINDVTDRDTTVVSYVHKMPLIQTTYSAEICKGDVYTDANFPLGLSVAGQHIASYQTVSGCDSSVILTLTVLDINVELRESLCEGDVYTFGTRELTETGIYVDTTLNARGCDSITVLYLTVLPTHYTEEVVSCDASYEWEGNLYTASGTYTATHTGANGCDSIVELHLTLLPSQYEAEATICQGSQYVFGDTILTTPGIYINSFARGNALIACDSVVILSLYVTPASVREINDRVCDNAEYFSFGFEIAELTSDTILERTIRTLEGCDSIIRVYLTVDPTYRTEFSAKINEGEIYDFAGSNYTVSGDYTARFFTEQGCDSIVTLHLTVEPVGVENAYMLPVVLAPNPIRVSTSSYVQHDWTAEERDGMQVLITSATGALVDKFAPTAFPIEISNIYTSGVYYVRIMTGNGRYYVGKLIVK